MKNTQIKMSNGYEIPQMGFGVYQIKDHDECKKAVLAALAAGCRHIDTAELYQNEQAVGEAIRESGIPREEIFLTTKVWCTNYGFEKAKAAIDRSLGRLQVSYVDLILLHMPYEDYIGAWKALEAAVDEGKVRSIGISNFDLKRIKKLLDNARIKPVVNQVECHPYFQQNEMKKYLTENDMIMEVYYPLGHGDKKLLTDPVLTSISEKYHKSVAQVILRWHIQEAHIVFPKSTNPAHIRDNMNIFDFTLTEEDMKKIRGIDKNKSYFNNPEWLTRFVCRLSGRRL